MNISIKTHGSKINKLAWAIVRKHGFAWREAIRAAFKSIRLMEQMKNQEAVEFSYMKKDRSLRPAMGTRNLDLIPHDKHPKGNKRDSVYNHTLAYFDLDANGWRSCLAINLI